MVEIKENIPLAPYTIYKIGGIARYFTEVHNGGELEEAVRFAGEKNMPFFVLGAGSNTLVSDHGFDGLVIRLTGGEIKTEGERLTAGAGVMMARAVMQAAASGLTGFEWGVGVPGTVGGSVRGNAGCFGGEMRDVVESVEVLDASHAATHRLRHTACDFSYRDSVFKWHPEWIILSATLKLKKDNPASIRQEIRRITAQRGTKQDIGTKSCGCMFKNPPWPNSAEEKEKLLREHPELARFAGEPRIPASFLIDRASLKGTCAGRARISERHANFFINEGGATAADIRALAARAKEKVHSLFDMALNEEIQYIGA